MNVVYKISVFDEVTEELVESRTVLNPDLEILWELLGSPDDDPTLCFGEYPFSKDNEKHWEYLTDILGSEPDFKKYSYFFGAFAPLKPAATT